MSCMSCFENTLSYTAPSHGDWGIVRIAALVPETHLLFVSPSACGRHGALAEKFAGIILKLMCYYRAAIDWNGWTERPDPALIDRAVAKIAKRRVGTLNCLFPDENALIVFDGDSLNIAVYNPGEEMRAILAALAQSEGLFWRPGA